MNARNKEGETPIFTFMTVPYRCSFEHGADLTIRNNKGQTVVDAAKSKGPQRQEVLRKAIENLSQR